LAPSGGQAPCGAASGPKEPPWSRAPASENDPVITGTLLLADAKTHHHRLGAGFDLLLLAHVACVIVALGAVVVSGVQAMRILTVPTGSPFPPTLRRYFAPGVNWVGRTLYGVPIFGFALLATSGGVFDLGDDWVGIGLALWAAAALCCEVFLWPAERQIQNVLAGSADPPVPSTLRAPAQTVAAMSVLLVVVLVTATVLMVAQP
jgi:hypothetical protein